MHIDFAIIGHSERRKYFNESDEELFAKALAALKQDIAPIFCCGELLEERQAGKHFDIVKSQLENTIFKLDAKEQRKAAMMSRPGSDGSNAFGRFLTVQAAYRDLASVPSFAAPPGGGRFALDAPHDKACVLAAMDDLLSAMLAQGPTPAQAK